jgi:hypothetical protein
MFMFTYNDIDTTDLLEDIDTHAKKNALECPLRSIMEHFAPANLAFLLLSCDGVNHELQRLSNFTAFWWLGQETRYHHPSLSMPATNRSQNQPCCYRVLFHSSLTGPSNRASEAIPPRMAA